MNSIATKTVRDLAVEIPGATRVFENLGIDYCCGGGQPLNAACAAAGVAVEDIMKSLELATASHAQFEEPNFLTATLAELIDHIVEKHHGFTKTEIGRLRALIDKVHGVHGQNHPELARLRFLFVAAKIWRHAGRTGVSYSDHYQEKGVFERLMDRLRRIAPRGQGYAPVMVPALR